MSAHGECVDHVPCPECGSSDNVAQYEDGYEKCFGMGCEYYKMPEGEAPNPRPRTARKPKYDTISDYEIRPLAKRNISEETCAKWKYGIGRFNNKNVHVANYITDGKVVGQKLRFANKDFLTLGDFKNVGLFGQHLWRDGGKSLVITEGEIDALSVSQLFNNKWPVVSLPNGAKSARRAIQNELEWVLKFEKVVLMFDNDEAGQMAVQDVVGLLPPGKVKIAQLPLKDANAMLVEGRGAEVVSAFWDAKTYRPDGILNIGDVRDAALKPIELGVSWPWSELTEVTYGRRDGEVYAIGAGTGVGKTDLFTQCIKHDAVDLDIKCGVLYLEQPAVETVRRIAGKLAGKKFHIPDGGWTVDELSDAIEQLDATDNVFLYNHFGTSDWETIQSRIRYMVVSLGCRHIYLDHLTALAAHAEDERRELEAIMADIAGMAQELGFKFHFISHLTTPDGKPHEEGGRVTVRHFKGSRAIGFWSHFMLGLERDQQASEESRNISTLRVLKDRYSGAATGFTMGLAYDHDTGLLSGCPVPDKDAGKKHGFKDETNTTQGDF